MHLLEWSFTEPLGGDGNTGCSHSPSSFACLKSPSCGFWHPWQYSWSIKAEEAVLSSSLLALFLTLYPFFFFGFYNGSTQKVSPFYRLAHQAPSVWEKNPQTRRGETKKKKKKRAKNTETCDISCFPCRWPGWITEIWVVPEKPIRTNMGSKTERCKSWGRRRRRRSSRGGQSTSGFRF